MIYIIKSTFTQNETRRMPQNRPVPRFYFRKTAKGNQGGSQHEKQRAGGDRPAKRYHEALPGDHRKRQRRHRLGRRKGVVGHLYPAQQPVCGDEDIQARHTGRGAGAGAEGGIRPHVYKGKEQRPDQRVLRRLSSGARHYPLLPCRCRRRGLHQIHLLQHEEKRLCRPCAVGLHHQLRQKEAAGATCLL